MRSDYTWRLAVVAIVVAISAWLIWPTINYFLAVSHRKDLTAEQRENLRRDSVPLGLDLQGGVDVLLEVDVEKTRQNKINDLTEDLRKAFRQESPPIDASIEAAPGSEAIVVTLNKQEQERSADNILARYRSDQYFPDYKSEQLKAGQPVRLVPNPEILKSDIVKTVESSLKVIRDRVDKLGVTQPVVVQQGSSRIRVQIPGEGDPEDVVATIIKPALLEFRGVHTTTDADAEGKYREDSQSVVDTRTGKPLEGRQIPPGYEARLYRDVKTDIRTGEQTTTERYMLVKTKTEMTGALLQDAWVMVNQADFDAPVQVWLEFKPEGARRFEEVTRTYRNRPLAILLDGVVYSAPNVETVISEGRCYIKGNFTQGEAKNLSLILKAGALPAEMRTIEKRTVEATLGADSIRASVLALAIGSIFVALYMITYYRIAGAIAVVGVIINVLLIFAFMKLANATLTLSGIGGILLTVGMAVDANTLIYERIREEIKSGKTLKTAISLGFNRAFSVIFDANLTTLISGLVLLQFGEGSVKGFALALNIGILANLFTGLFVTHALVDFWFAVRQHFNIGNFRWFREGIYIDFIKMRKWSYIFSGTLFLVSILYIMPFVHGSNWGVDFSGGLLSEVEVTTPTPPNTQQVKGDFQDWRVQKSQDKFLIRTKLVDGQIPATQQEVASRLDRTVGAGNYRILGNEAVGTEVGREFTRKAIIATIIASIGILLYVGMRFEFAFGFAAVVALFHDVIITYGIFNILGSAGMAGEVTLDVVSALLVVLGYSVNDTIVIFDRVRENLKIHAGMPFRELINRSISETLNRTFMTGTTVIMVLAVMLLMGGTGLFDFALVLLLGIIKGTYSSIFIASPILYEMHLRAHRKHRGGSTGEQVVQPMLRERV
jgi:SecD/SecF fusion protein